MVDRKLNLFVILALISFVLLPRVSAICGVCGETHACVSRNEFQVCNDGVRDTNVTFKCETDTEVCTVYGIICMEESATVKPACGDLSQCGACDNVPDSRFACTSRTTFTMCFNGEPFGTLGNCPSDMLCSVSGGATGKPCMDQCLIDQNADICDREADVGGDSTTVSPSTTTTTTTGVTTTLEPQTTTVDSTSPTTTPTLATTTNTISSTTSPSGSSDSTVITDEPITTTTIFQPTPPSDTTTTTSSTTTTVTPQTAAELCSTKQFAGRYPYPEDTTCTSYLNCFRKAGNMTGINMNCTTGLPYFNANTKLCGTQRPTTAGCL